VGNVGDVGEPRRVVDDDLEMIEAERSSTARTVLPAEEAMTASSRDPTELLVILVDERPRGVVDVADRDAAQAIGIAQAAVTGPRKDGVDRRGGDAQERPDAVRSPAALHPRAKDRLHQVRSGGTWRAMRSRTAILEAGPALRP